MPHIEILGMTRGVNQLFMSIRGSKPLFRNEIQRNQGGWQKNAADDVRQPMDAWKQTADDRLHHDYPTDNRRDETKPRPFLQAIMQLMDRREQDAYRKHRMRRRIWRFQTFLENDWTVVHDDFVEKHIIEHDEHIESAHQPDAFVHSA